MSWPYPRALGRGVTPGGRGTRRAVWPDPGVEQHVPAAPADLLVAAQQAFPLVTGPLGGPDRARVPGRRAGGRHRPNLTAAFPDRCNRIVCALTAWWVPFHE